MRIYKQMALFSCALLATSQILAAPIITKTAGEFVKGQTITISGSGFSTAKAVPLLWDTVDNQGGASSDKQKVPYGNGYTWGENTHDDAWGTDVIFSTDKNRAGRSSSYAGGKRSDLGWPNAVKGQNLKNIYVSWWLWVSEDPADNGGANKFIRVWDDSDGTGTRVSWTSTLLGYKSGTPDWEDWGGKNGQWNRMEIWVSDDSKTVKTWVNGEIRNDVRDFSKLGSNGLNVYLIGFDPSVSNYYPDFTFRMSDIYISPTIARVELSNKANWNDKDAIREVQPVKSWGESEVSIQLNFGGFDNITNKYLYLVDSNGNVNQSGFPLCIKCPEAPVLEIE